ncbi:hypothetical protein [Clavibacter michiganensis]|jgi:membrane protein implicated in regulation of membrane protease activity|uniref:Uncharacterized protein n=1 Tax=Clavibacter michiganensis subsp. insidiosus TaxID=33014 RepID=A0A0D5CJC8_9MICO|nr:hypothetical protein [Clavibacter michiganensis]AJW79721.1 hypothetical protein VO01_11825 [Clavibacter michiganensis subsp. insidiosus]AWF99103.1 hypothetical protein BEH61_11380 [Clavibacter michiganensis subsp. insidiosus]AWG02259.1 hypothetical protein BEH62_11690 [Clavibacter michiganensis subsp. insidiosus]OQJ59280.1 hypothetical protein B5P21_04705 [Clavibacter michiganensis subsp. insidiosus]RII85845.1 hypothetical protein DZF92_12775 [Clavibacter michiganensis subsp. insidiosus]
MADDKMTRDAWIFRIGLAVLVILPVAVFVPLASTTGDAPVLFFVQVVLAASWVAWFARRKRRARRDGQP